MDAYNTQDLKVKVVMLKGEKGEKGADSYDDTQIRTEIARVESTANTALNMADTATQTAETAESTANTAIDRADTAMTQTGMIGTGNLDTESQTIIPAINELNSELRNQVIWERVSVAVNKTINANSTTGDYKGAWPSREGYTFHLIGGHTQGNSLMVTGNGWICNPYSDNRAITNVVWFYIGIKD